MCGVIGSSGGGGEGDGSGRRGDGGDHGNGGGDREGGDGVVTLFCQAWLWRELHIRGTEGLLLMMVVRFLLFKVWSVQ